MYKFRQNRNTKDERQMDETDYISTGDALLIVDVQSGSRSGAVKTLNWMRAAGVNILKAAGICVPGF